MHHGRSSVTRVQVGSRSGSRETEKDASALVQVQYRDAVQEKMSSEKMAVPHKSIPKK